MTFVVTMSRISRPSGSATLTASNASSSTPAAGSVELEEAAGGPLLPSCKPASARAVGRR
jgi:hypothetical protein